LSERKFEGFLKNLNLLKNKMKKSIVFDLEKMVTDVLERLILKTNQFVSTAMLRKVFVNKEIFLRNSFS
jgi:hypothetical protein